MISSYILKNTPVHSLDPRVKFVFTIIFITCTFFAKGIIPFVSLGGIIVIPLFLAKIPPSKIMKGIIPFLPFIILTLLFHFLLTPGEIIFEFGVITGTKEGIMNGVIFSSRLFLLLLSTLLFGLTTNPIDFAESFSNLFRKFKSNLLKEIPMIIIFVLRFIPLLIQEGKRIIRAQKARGCKIKIGKELLTILLPIINLSFRKADELALALNAKGFEPGAKRTLLYNFKLKANDYGAIIYSILPIVVVILL